MRASHCCPLPHLPRYVTGQAFVEFSAEGDDKPHTVASTVQAERVLEHYFDVVK